MDKWISYDKLSKKEKRKHNQAKRQTWGVVSPVTRKPTNDEAMQSMSPKQMEDILDQVYLAGLNNGMYAARQDDDSILDTNPFDLRWLKKSAEKATRFETDKEGDDYMLCALCEAIFRNAGIPVQE